MSIYRILFLHLGTFLHVQMDHMSQIYEYRRYPMAQVDHSTQNGPERLLVMVMFVQQQTFKGDIGQGPTLFQNKCF